MLWRSSRGRPLNAPAAFIHPCQPIVAKHERGTNNGEPSRRSCCANLVNKSNSWTNSGNISPTFPMSRQGVPRRSSALCAIAASAKPRLNSYMAREPNGPSNRAARTTLKRPERPERPDQDEPRPKGQARPIEERFLLRVDGQMKSSFSSKETAVTAGAKIKKAYPIVVVTVVDTEAHTTEIINA
jgi:hypothetical protein